MRSAPQSKAAPVMGLQTKALSWQLMAHGAISPHYAPHQPPPPCRPREPRAHVVLLSVGQPHPNTAMCTAPSRHTLIWTAHPAHVGCGVQAAGCRMWDAGWGMQDEGCRTEHAGWGMQDRGCKTGDAGWGMQDGGCTLQGAVSARCREGSSTEAAARGLHSAPCQKCTFSPVPPPAALLCGEQMQRPHCSCPCEPTDCRAPCPPALTLPVISCHR